MTAAVPPPADDQAASTWGRRLIAELCDMDANDVDEQQISDLCCYLAEQDARDIALLSEHLGLPPDEERDGGDIADAIVALRLRAEVLSGLLRGMAHRASRLRRQTNALINDKAAVRALADDLERAVAEAIEQRGPIAALKELNERTSAIRAALGGPADPGLSPEPNDLQTPPDPHLSEWQTQMRGFLGKRVEVVLNKDPRKVVVGVLHHFDTDGQVYVEDEDGAWGWAWPCLDIAVAVGSAEAAEPRADCGCCEASWRLCRGLYDKGMPRCCSDCTHNLDAEAAEPTCGHSLEDGDVTRFCVRTDSHDATRAQPHHDGTGVEWWGGDVHTIRPTSEAAEPHPWEAEAALPGEWAEVERDAQKWREHAPEPARASYRMFRAVSDHMPVYGPGVFAAETVTACRCGVEKDKNDLYGGWWAWHVAHVLDDVRAGSVTTTPAAPDVPDEALRFLAAVIAAGGGEVRIPSADLLNEWTVVRLDNVDGSVTFHSRLAGTATTPEETRDATR